MYPDAASFASLRDDPAMALLRAGQVDEALRVAKARVSEARQAEEDGDGSLLDLSSALERLGTLERELGNVEEAEAALREALELAQRAEAALGLLAGMRTNLATLLDFSQREADAVSLYEQAIADYEAMDPPEAEVAAQLRNNLAMIYKGLGKFALAEQHYLRALEALETKEGAQSEPVASVYNNLGGLYYTAGFAEQAKEMFTQGLKTRFELLGENHPDVAQSHCNLATVCHELGDNAKAVEHFERGLEILEANIEQESASYEAVAMDFISLLELMGDERKVAVVRKRMQRTLA
jgi:tetratricopeptide (TPR) repeat protein